MNGLQQLIAQWHLLTQQGEFSLYTNPKIALANYIVIDPTPAIVSLEVFRALGYAPPFSDQTTAEAAMVRLIALGGTAAIPGILAQSGSVPPIATVPPTAPIAPVPVAPAVNSVDLPGVGYPEPSIDATAIGGELAALTPPVQITPIAAPIYPTAEDYEGTTVSRVISVIDDLLHGIRSLEPIADKLAALVAGLATEAIAANPIAVQHDPETRAMPSIARSVNADGFNWYLMIGRVANLSQAQAIEQQVTLLRAAKFTRTPKLDPPEDADVAGFGEVWYQKISQSQAERLAWLDGAKLPVHNM